MILEGLEFSKEGIRSLENTDQFIEKCMMLIETDIKIFY